MLHKVSHGAAISRGHNRQAKIHGFIDNNPPRLAVGRQDENIADGITSGHLRVILKTRKVDTFGIPGTDQRLKFLSQWAVAGNQKMSAVITQHGKSRNQVVDALQRNQAANGENHRCVFWNSTFLSKA